MTGVVPFLDISDFFDNVFICSSSYLPTHVSSVSIVKLDLIFVQSIQSNLNIHFLKDVCLYLSQPVWFATVTKSTKYSFFTPLFWTERPDSLCTVGSLTELISLPVFCTRVRELRFITGFNSHERWNPCLILSKPFTVGDFGDLKQVTFEFPVIEFN